MHQLETPSMTLFWMSESYLYYIEYVDFLYRFAALERVELEE